MNHQHVPSGQPGRERQQHRPSGLAIKRPLVTLLDAFVAPFQSHPERARNLSVEQLERQRRRLILRLILTFILLSLLLIALPVSVAQGEPLSAFVVFFGLILLAIVGLWANQKGYTTAAASVFVAGAFGATVGFAASRSADHVSVAVSYANLGLFLLIAGLTLPTMLLWGSAIVAGVLTAGGLVFFPFAPDLSSGSGGTSGLGLVPQLISFQMLTALLTQVYVSSVRASVRATVSAYQQERELAALKDQFLIDANHELRTPIMALTSNVQLLAKLGERASSADRTRVLGRAVSASIRLQQLLHNVLDAGALASSTPRVEPAPVALDVLIRDTLETFNPAEIGEPGLTERAAQARSVRVSVPTDLVVYADPARLRQILINLVANAIKYSEPGTPLAIRATVMEASPRPNLHHHRARGQNRMVQVSIQDHGLGVPPAEAHHLFQRFVRLQRDIAGPVRGTGVGLYVTRSLVEAMGGRIWVESQGIPGEGSTFHFTVPAMIELPNDPAVASDREATNTASPVAQMHLPA